MFWDIYLNREKGHEFTFAIVSIILWECPAIQ